MLKKLGLILLVIAVVLLLGYGLYNLFVVIFNEPELPVVIKIALLVLILALIILFIAIFKERIEDHRQGR